MLYASKTPRAPCKIEAPLFPWVCISYSCDPKINGLESNVKERASEWTKWESGTWARWWCAPTALLYAIPLRFHLNKHFGSFFSIISLSISLSLSQLSPSMHGTSFNALKNYESKATLPIHYQLHTIHETTLAYFLLFGFYYYVIWLFLFGKS